MMSKKTLVETLYCGFVVVVAAAFLLSPYAARSVAALAWLAGFCSAVIVVANVVTAILARRRRPRA